MAAEIASAPARNERENEGTRGKTLERVRRAISLRRNLRSLFVPPEKHLRQLDAFRALSILWVVVFHAGWYAAPVVPLPVYGSLLASRWMLPLWRGDFGVDVFFVLSGFLIAGLLIDERERTGRLGLGRFYVRRLLRLWPALGAATILYVLLIGQNASMIWANLFYVSNFIPIVQAAMGWTWSLAIEEQFYLACPWLVVGLAQLTARARWMALAGIVVGLCLVGAYVIVSGGFTAIDAEIVVNRDYFRWAQGFDHLYVKPWMRAGPLLVGMMAAYAYRAPRVMDALGKSRTAGTLALVGALGVAAVSTHWPIVVDAPRGWEVVYLAAFRTTFGLGIGYVVLLSLSRHPLGATLGRILSARAFYPIGQLAYSAYLLNPIVCLVVHPRLALLVGEGTASPIALFLPVDLVATFAGAMVLHLVIERPLMELRPGLRSAEHGEAELAPSPSEATAEVAIARDRADVDRWLLVFAIAIATLIAWLNRFIQDDAFISFRYARHLAEGHGLVWNVGEKAVAGFTNPLWTLLIALGMRVGIEPVFLSQAMGLGCFLVTLAATAALASRLCDSRRVGIAAVLALGLNASFSAYATGGLETQSQAMLVVVLAWCVVQGLEPAASRGKWFALASVTAGLALWTRLDSALFVAALLSIPLLEAWRARSGRLAASVALPCGLIGASLIAFNWLLFRSIVPNTFYAKTAGLDSALVLGGLDYVALFFRHYQLVPVLAIALYVGRGRLRSPPPIAIALLGATAIWGLYIVAVGGDFMEFRLIVPVLPIGVVICAWLLVPGGTMLPGITTLASVVCSALFYRDVSQRLDLGTAAGVETVHGLDAHITEHDQDWAEIGRSLPSVFACDRDVTIAVMAAGAIPYYSDFRTIDMLGLSDPWVARHGTIYGHRPGHMRGATLPYLVSKRVNLVLHPWRRSDPEQLWSEYSRALAANRYVPMSRAEDLPASAEIIEIPIAPDRKLRALYLVRDPKLDRCIAAGGWRVFPMHP